MVHSILYPAKINTLKSSSEASPHSKPNLAPAAPSIERAATDGGKRCVSGRTYGPMKVLCLYAAKMR